MTIGDNNKIAAGMTIYKPVGDNETIMFKHLEKIVIKDSGNL
jgi:serine acetyltransferase